MSQKRGFNRLPPLSALRGFEAAARLNSFSKASSELFMTQSAISHQVKLLEDYFGQPLFKRVNRTVEVTDAGIDFLKTTQLVLGQLQKGAIRLEFFNKPGLVVLTTPPSFANKWLMSRLHEFNSQNPDLNVWVYTKYSQEELEHAEVDLAIWHGTGEWTGVEKIKLFDDKVTPLYSPKLLTGEQQISEPEDLKNFPLIHVEQVERREDWQAWFSMLGLGEVSTVLGYNFNDSSLALDYAVSGQGVVLGSTILAKDLIESGELIKPFDSYLNTELDYYLVYRKEKVEFENVERFRRWILAEFNIDSCFVPEKIIDDAE
ncbi:transcriptional regulator GcvA [Aliikangiella coralliicola]|nr:transcriptional regulator GcvA [Aliikangiella coralliicola]